MEGNRRVEAPPGARPPRHPPGNRGTRGGTLDGCRARRLRPRPEGRPRRGGGAVSGGQRRAVRGQRARQPGAGRDPWAHGGGVPGAPPAGAGRGGQRPHPGVQPEAAGHAGRRHPPGRAAPLLRAGHRGAGGPGGAGGPAAPGGLRGPRRRPRRSRLGRSVAGRAAGGDVRGGAAVPALQRGQRRAGLLQPRSAEGCRAGGAGRAGARGPLDLGRAGGGVHPADGPRRARGSAAGRGGLAPALGARDVGHGAAAQLRRRLPQPGRRPGGDRHPGGTRGAPRPAGAGPAPAGDAPGGRRGLGES